MTSNDTANTFTLFHRPSRRHRWRAVGSAPTSADALRLMEGTGLRGGHWAVSPVGTDPNNDKPVTNKR